MRLDLTGLEPRVLAGEGDVVHALVLHAGELVQHIVVKEPQHLDEKGREGADSSYRQRA